MSPLTWRGRIMVADRDARRRADAASTSPGRASGEVEGAPERSGSFTAAPPRKADRFQVDDRLGRPVSSDLASASDPAVSSKAAGPDGAAESEREHFGADRVGTPPTSVASPTKKDEAPARTGTPSHNNG